MDERTKDRWNEAEDRRVEAALRERRIVAVEHFGRVYAVEIHDEQPVCECHGSPLCPTLTT